MQLVTVAETPDHFRLTWEFDTQPNGTAMVSRHFLARAKSFAVVTTGWLAADPLVRLAEELGYGLIPPDYNRGQVGYALLEDESFATMQKAMGEFLAHPEIVEYVEPWVEEPLEDYRLNPLWRTPKTASGWRETNLGWMAEVAEDWFYHAAYGFLYLPWLRPQITVMTPWQWSPARGWIVIAAGAPDFFYAADSNRWWWLDQRNGEAWPL